MPDRLRTITHEATQGFADLLGGSFDTANSEQIDRLIEDAVIRALLEGQHRAVDATLQCPQADQDMAPSRCTRIRNSTMATFGFQENAGAGMNINADRKQM